MNNLIEKHLYHRAPNLLLEEVLEYGKEGMQTSLFLGEDHPLIQGHFPNLPIFPGTQMMEMIIQTGGVHMAETFYPEHRVKKESVGVLRKIEKAKFVNFARPSQRLTCSVLHLGHIDEFHQYRGEVRNQKGELLMKAEVSLVTIPEETLRG